MRFEVVEYIKDKDGNKMAVTSYEIEQIELSKTIDSLNERIKDGGIYDVDITPV